MPRIDLVADLGERFGAWTMGDDEALLDLLTSANVACGFHAGDPRIMDATVRATASSAAWPSARTRAFPIWSGSAAARWI